MSDRRYWDEELETLPWPDLQQLQVKSVPDLVARITQCSPLYAELLDGVDPSRLTSISAMAEAPTLTKDDLRRGQESADPDRILGRQQCAGNDEIVEVYSSSGTTGKPVAYGLTAADLSRWAKAIGGLFFTAGVRKKSVVGLSTAMPMVAGGLPFADAIREVGAALVWFGGQPTERMVATIDAFAVDTLVATASFTTYFAERVPELIGKPASALGIETLIAGGEPGMGQPETRARVLDSWGAQRLSEIMGLGDVMAGVWAECEAGTGMHFTVCRDVLAELIDPASGDPVEWNEGAEGELVYTTLTRQATPVFRFRSRDHIQVQGMSCSCGRSTPRIRCIGRTDDMLIYKAMNVFPAAIRDVAISVADSEIDGLMRVRKETADQVRYDHPIPVEVQLRAPIAPDAEAAMKARIEEAVRSRLRVRVAVETLAAGTLTGGTYKSSLTYVAE